MPHFQCVSREPPGQCIPMPACEACSLAECPPGLRVTVLDLGCAAPDAQRLRTLGLFEGMAMQVIHTRSGMLLDVRGSRLALGMELAATITVQPVTA